MSPHTFYSAVQTTIRAPFGVITYTSFCCSTCPIAFGLTSRKLFINKNGSTLLLPSANKYATVAQYAEKPFVNGYTSKQNISRVSNSAAIIFSQSGNGQVVLFADDPTYRAYWLGTTRLFINSIFFANLAGGFGNFGAEEEQE